MSLKSLLQPVIAQHLLSRERLLRARVGAERRRLRHGLPHELHYFHQVDDPYSALAVQALPRLLQAYGVVLLAHVVSAPAAAAAPEREKLVTYSRRDAALLARLWDLDFVDPGTQPSADRLALATRALVLAADSGRFAAQAGAVCAALWSGAEQADIELERATDAQAQAHVAAADALRAKLGHYLGAMFFYGGEWYWGLDRLHHLEQRLQALGAGRNGANGAGDAGGLLFAPPADLRAPQPLQAPASIDFFVSLRSPYTAIVAPRVYALSRLTGAPVVVRYVLPMVMRGLPVPANKRRYISQDTAREAHRHGIPFGRLNDPVGRPTERGLALMPLAERHGLTEAYLLSFLRGVWAEGIDAGSDRGLRRIAERAGLDWGEALLALQDQAWRATAETNRALLFSLGLWGVPSFRVGSTAVWGQDRLWAVQQALLGEPT